MKQLIRDRIFNASRDAIKSRDPGYKGQVAAGGAVAYALLEVAGAIDSFRDSPYVPVVQFAEFLIADIQEVIDTADTADADVLRKNIKSLQHSVNQMVSTLNSLDQQ